MGSNHKSVYLMLPIPGKNDLEPVRVDYDRLVEMKARVLSLYEHVGGSERGKGRKGMHTPMQVFIDWNTLDTEKLTNLIDEVSGELLEQLSHSEYGKILTPLARTTFELNKLIEALAHDNVDLAEEAIEKLKYSLMTEFAKLVSQNERLAQQASLTELYHTTWEHLNEAERSDYTNWMNSILEYTKTLDELVDLEVEFRLVKDVIETERKNWECMLKDSDSGLSQPLNDLDNDETGFIVTAYQYSEKGNEDSEEIATLLVEAQLNIEACRAIEIVAQSKWAENFERYQRAVLSRQPETERLILSLKKLNSTLRSLEEEYPPGTLRPFQVPGTTISAADYKAATEALHSYDWGPETIGNKLRSLRMSCESILGEKPELSENAQYVIRMAERQITSIEEALIKEKPAPTKKRAKGKTVEVPSQPQAEIDPKRLEEICEMVYAVTHILTCRPLMLAATTIESALEILVFLKKITDSEHATYLQAINARLLHPDEVEVITDPKGGFLTERWKQSTATWLQYKLSAWKWFGYKMTRTVGQSHSHLAEKYGLDAESVGEARLKRKSIAWAKIKNRSE